MQKTIIMTSEYDILEFGKHGLYPRGLNVITYDYKNWRRTLIEYNTDDDFKKSVLVSLNNGSFMVSGRGSRRNLHYVYQLFSGDLVVQSTALMVVDDISKGEPQKVYKLGPNLKNILKTIQPKLFPQLSDCEQN